MSSRNVQDRFSELGLDNQPDFFKALGDSMKFQWDPRALP